jgi:hypothetical protein
MDPAGAPVDADNSNPEGATATTPPTEDSTTTTTLMQLDRDLRKINSKSMASKFLRRPNERRRLLPEMMKSFGPSERRTLQRGRGDRRCRREAESSS